MHSVALKLKCDWFLETPTFARRIVQPDSIEIPKDPLPVDGTAAEPTLEEEVLRVLVRVLAGTHDVEGGVAGQHLVQQHTQGPPVHAEVCMRANRRARQRAVCRSPARKIVLNAIFHSISLNLSAYGYRPRRG